MKKILYIIIIAIIVISVVIFLLIKNLPIKKPASPTSSPLASMTSSQENVIYSAIPAETTTLIEPVADFKARITKKPFGIYITPQNSPVRPEKYTGYHTGVDAEYGDVISDTAVYAIANGEVMANQFVSGYGGVLVIKHNINGQKILTLYGHLNLDNSPKVGEQVKKNQQIAILGKDKSAETDRERKHLHFGMIKDNNINYRGYVSTKSQLSGWYNPMDFYQ